MNRPTHNRAQDMSGNLKRPPSWSPEMERDYPFRFWMVDTIMWALATDIPEDKQGPVIVMALGGTAKAMAREIPPAFLIHGADVDLQDGNGQQHVNGCMYILIGLAKRFGPISEETNVSALADLYGFNRLPNETTDELLARFEVVRHRA
eukprot:3161273-Amphidinium_carterae.1